MNQNGTLGTAKPAPPKAAGAPAEPAKNKTCYGPNGRPDGPGTTSLSGENNGTNVFTHAKTNATDAAGLVGTNNFTIPVAPYTVERCDQILQIKGERMNLDDYCIREPAFMTLSIYMANLFSARNPDKLQMSIHFDELVQVPAILAGTPKCIKWMGKNNQWGFCYESAAVAHQIVLAYQKFYECTKGGDLPLIDVLLEACDLSKIDFSEKGPFGKDGPRYWAKIQAKQAIKSYGYGKVDKALIYDPMKLNKYYSLTQAPGTN